MNQGTTLTDAVRLWPTPNASLMNDGESPESWERRNATLRENGINGNGMGTPLTIAATTWPTPGANDHKGSAKEGQRRGQLDEAVEQLYPCAPPALTTVDGPNSSTGGHGSRPRLNPGFVCWLMGLPWWWTRAESISCAQREMVSYRSLLRLHLCTLLARLESSSTSNGMLW